jgi:hypothetical protein
VFITSPKDKTMKIGFAHIKQALLDPRFRDTLPVALGEDVAKFLSNPGCPCNTPIYKRVLQEAIPQLKAYFPKDEVLTVSEDAALVAKNNWSVIYCHRDELQDRLRALPPGRKQIAPALDGDMVLVVVNELDVIFDA